MSSPAKANDGLFYGWVIVSVFFVIGIIIFGIRLSFGVFFKSIESEFLLSRAATSAIFSTYMALGAIFAILGGWAADRHGPKVVMLIVGIGTGLGLLLTGQTNAHWQLFITFSLLLSVGSGAIFAVLTSTISRWFDRKRTFALGVAQSGAGFGIVLMAPLAVFLITALDWRMAYIVLGIIALLVIIPLSLLLRKEPGKTGTVPQGETLLAKSVVSNGKVTTTIDLPLTRVFSSRSFWFLLTTYMLFGSSRLLITTHVVPHATDMGIPATKAAVILSMMGGSAIPGRVLMGMIADRIGRKSTAIIALSIQTLAVLWLIWAQNLQGLYLFALIYGFGQGGFSPAMSALIGDTFGLLRIGPILGAVDVGFNIGAAIGPLIGGFIFDINNSYSMAFVYAASATLMASLLISMVKQKTGVSY